MDIDLMNAIKSRNFLALCQRSLPEYAKLCQGKHGPRPGTGVNAADVRAAAEEAGCLAAFERDMALAPLAICSRQAIHQYVDNGGKPLLTFDDCSMECIKNRGKDNEYSIRVSSPIIIVAEGHNTASEGACLQLLIRSTTGVYNEIFVARKDVIAGSVLQGRLQDAGLLPGDYPTLLHVLQNIVPNRQFDRVEHAGWNDNRYATPGGEVLPHSDNAVATFDPLPNFVTGGTLEEANATLAALKDNYRFVFAFAAALSAPFVAQVGALAEPGGFHFYGASSRGKTTQMAFAASAWGCGAEKKDNGIVESWNTTSFAAEIAASQHNDCAMFLDEIRAADPDHFAKLALGLANGAGKRAGKADGGLREARTFRPTLLSTGEISSRDYITSNKLAYHGGMSVRIVDIRADAGAGLGIFNKIPAEFNDAAAFADWIKLRSSQHYGHHGCSIVAAFIDDREVFLRDLHEAIHTVTTSLQKAKPATDPQAKRVCKRIGFVAGVAIVACNRNIVPWGSADVFGSALNMFEDWLESRGGGNSSQEGVAAEDAFESFIYANPNRFDRDGVTAQHSRIGMTRLDSKGYREYWIANKEGLIEMIGLQPERLVPFLEHVAKGHSSNYELVGSKDRMLRDSPKGAGLPKRCYCFRSRHVELTADNDEGRQENDFLRGTRVI